MSDDGVNYGVCPHCGYRGGIANIGKGHWGYCTKHIVRWLIGLNLFSSYETEEEQRKLHRKIGISKMRTISLQDATFKHLTNEQESYEGLSKHQIAAIAKKLARYDGLSFQLVPPRRQYRDRRLHDPDLIRPTTKRRLLSPDGEALTVRQWYRIMRMDDRCATDNPLEFPFSDWLQVQTSTKFRTRLKLKPLLPFEELRRAKLPKVCA